MLFRDYFSNSIFSILAKNLDEASASSCLMLATALDALLVPLELIHNNRDSVRKAREAHLIDRAMTLEPRGVNRRDELLFFLANHFLLCCISKPVYVTVVL